MTRTMCKSKIHRATVTDANLNYVGSITIDKTLLREADLVQYEMVQIVNINNGERFETYIIEGQADSGVICLNGAAARLVMPGDLVIIIAYGAYTEDELKNHEPRIVHVDAKNRIIA
jgi:aspartate 1-decarboxylase